jgi:hypothetical protein
MIRAINQPMVCPRISGDFDYEGELAVIIGKPGRHIPKSDALSHVFGYTCFNDGSIRDIQFKHSIAAGKNFHATGGFGSWIVTADEIPDPTRLHLVTRLNGKEVQHTGIDLMPVAGDDRTTARHACRLAPKIARPAGQHVAQGSVPVALGCMADQVVLAELLGADHDIIGHVSAQIRSAKVRSVRRK